MPRFIKKPVEIEAVQFLGIDIDGQPQFSDEDAWVGDAFRADKIRVHPIWPERLQVATTEGDMIAGESDWIIKGVEGEIYPCRDSVFEKTYDPA